MDSVTLKRLAHDKLIANLEDLLKQYRLLLDCVRKEKDFLIASDIEKLNENNQLKEVLLTKIKALDAIRMTYAIELANHLQADSSQPRLLDLALKMGGAEGERLRVLHAAFEMVIKRLSDLNKENDFFANNALRTVSSALDSFKESVLGQKTYQSQGKYKKQADASGFLVKKEA